MLVFALQAIHAAGPLVPPVVFPFALLATAAVIGTVLLLLHPKQPAIQLPTTTVNGVPLTPGEKRYKEPDVEQVDLAERHFLPDVRKRKLITSCTVAGLVTVAVFKLAWHGLLGFVGGGWQKLVEDIVEVVVWSFALALSLLSLPHPLAPNSPRSAATHWRLTLSLFALLTLSLTFTAFRLILPRSTGLSLLPEPELDGTVKHIERSLLGASIFLQTAGFLLVGQTPRSAPLIVARARGSKQPQKRVLALPSSSPLSYLLFSWVTPILSRAYKASRDPTHAEEPLDEASLPALPAAERAINVWEGVKGTQSWMEPQNVPRGWNALLWRIVRVNRPLFIIQASLSVLNAGLYYLPAFFLQRLVAFLEERPPPGETRSMQWGYVYCIGLFASAVFEAIVSGQLWFVSNSILATRIRVQLNTLIFSKTLLRKDVSGVSAPSNSNSNSKPSSDADGSEGSDEDDEDEDEKKNPTFKSKSSITNLFSVDADRVSDFAVWSFSVYDAPVEILIGTLFLYSLIGYAALLGISVAVVFLPLNNWTSKGFTTTQDKLMATRDRRVGLMNEVLGSIRMIKFYAFEKPFEERVVKARADELHQLRNNFLLEVCFSGIWSISPILCVLISFWAYTSPLLMNQELTPSTAFASLAIWNELRFSLNVIPDVLQSALQCLVSLRRIEAYLRMPEIDHLAQSSSSSSAPDDGDDTLVDVPQAEEPPVAFQGATVTWPRNAEDEEDSQAGDDAASERTSAPKAFELQDVEVEFPKGELTLVCGRLGSGKTLLLLSLLGEVDVLSGTVSCPRSSPSAIALPSLDWDAYLTPDNWTAPHQTAFVPQQAWLQNTTLRNNITFGLPYRERRYRAVLKACSLESDLKLLEDGDQTEIGEKGINLSGGQKARVSLARAVYSRASLLLLDDVLSAVDAHTATHIYKECLKGPLLAGRTVILVSHHVQLTAPGAKLVVELDNGRVKFAGSSEDYLQSDSFKAVAGDDKEGADEPTSPRFNTAVLPSTSPSKPTVKPAQPAKPLPKSFAAIVAESTPNASSTEVSSASEDDDESSSEDEQDPQIDGPEGKLDAAASGKTGNGTAAGEGAGGSKKKQVEVVEPAGASSAAGAGETDTEAEAETERKPRKLIEEEGRAVGHVEWGVWRLYLGLCGGVLFWGVFVATFGGTRLADVAQSAWLAKWAGDEAKTHSVSYYLAIYACLSLLAVIIETLQGLVLYYGTLRASAKLHHRLLHAILRAPLRFFDTQALGRIQNRFAKDLESIDSALPDHVGRTIEYGLGVITTLVVISISSPTFLIGFAILSIAYYQQARLFSYSAREFRRLDSVTKSPLFSIYSEAIAGVAVIRSFGASARFMALMLERTTRNVNYYYLLWCTNRWLSMRYSLLSAVVVGLTGYVLIAAGNKVDAALAGFTLTFSLNIANELLFLVRRWTQLELAMVGVERVKEFAEIKQEAAEIVEPRPPAHWPQGQIDVRNLEIRYAPELPSVLHDLSFSIKAGEKVGIVGATGCGKSTLASSFFRFVEATSGAIVIDGIDISKIGLLDLRSRLTIVPQDPVILSGSLRSTLDMFGAYEDHEIFDALRRVHLIKEGEQPDSVEAGANRSVFWNLDAEVAEGGTNFSTGQRQLLCMARALLRRNKILLLDEATASTDHETDELITQTIRSEFADSTLLVIAHRLRTIIDFDKVLLLDKGKLIEFDSPAKLIEDPNSRFHALCRAAGKKELAILRKMSKGKARVTHKPRKLVRRSTTNRTIKPVNGDEQQ
ncbi:hypothetical protein JCM8097_001359 [Rhodosporidiobolus ruineniae]